MDILQFSTVRFQQFWMLTHLGYDLDVTCADMFLYICLVTNIVKQEILGGESDNDQILFSATLVLSTAVYYTPR